MTRKETICAVLFVCVVIAMPTIAITEAVLYSQVDYSQAKFEQGQMVKMLVGGEGQVMRRDGVNEGYGHWDLTPVFRYEVRHAWLNGGVTKTWFEEWELEHIEER